MPSNETDRFNAAILASIKHLANKESGYWSGYIFGVSCNIQTGQTINTDVIYTVCYSDDYNDFIIKAGNFLIQNGIPNLY